MNSKFDIIHLPYVYIYILNKMSGCRNCLKKVSVGQYTTPFFYQGVDRVSSVPGGLLTILCGLFLATYTAYLVNSAI